MCGGLECQARESRLDCMDDGEPTEGFGGKIGLPTPIISKDKSLQISGTYYFSPSPLPSFIHLIIFQWVKSPCTCLTTSPWLPDPDTPPSMGSHPDNTAAV